MTAESIRNVVATLSPDSPYFRWGFAAMLHAFEFSSLAERLDLALSDPAFGGNLAKAYATGGLPMPTGIGEGALLRAYDYLLNPNSSDVNMAMAFQIVLPESMPQRDLLRPLLICRDMSPNRVAELCALNPEVVSIFETLFWNCLDRKQERPYIARICQCRQSGLATTEAEPGQAELGRQLLRIAYHNGQASFVLDAAGLITAPGERPPKNKLYDQIVCHTLASAGIGLAAGSVSKSSNPALEPALKIIAARKKHKLTDQKVITGPSLGESLMSYFKELVPADMVAEIERENGVAPTTQPGVAARMALRPPVVYPDVLPPPPPKEET